MTVADLQRPVASARPYHPIQGGTVVSVEDNKVVIRRSIEDGENRADLGVLEDCYATDYVHQYPQSRRAGLARAERSLSRLLRRFSQWPGHDR